MTEKNAELYFDVAARHVKSVGRIASNFSSAVRAITLAELKYGNKRSPETRKACQRYVLPWLKRSPSLKAVFYFAAQSMYEEELEAQQSLTLSKLLDVFAPGEVASILGLIYVSRRLEAMIDPTEWQRISTLFQMHMEIGALVGERIPSIGRGTGMLIGGIRVLGYALLASKDLTTFRMYRRTTKERGELFDLDFEVRHWQCNHLHIASSLVQNLGYGLQAGLGIGLGVGANSVASPQQWFDGLDEESQCWQVAISWIEALHCLSEPPNFVPQGHELALSKQESAHLQKLAKALLAKGSTFRWTQCTRDDLTEEIHLRLGLVFDAPSEVENIIFEEIERSSDYVELDD